jgi:type II secretory pathway pseudopilin PulG
MTQRIKPSVCPSRSRPTTQPSLWGPGCGYALLIVMMLATVLLISLSAALPNIYTAGMREREEELIFRGNQYARAIVLFRRQFRRYPTSVKELLQTSGIRFLRREYTDPMSRKGKWRFIHADASGMILDSLTLRRSPATQAGKTEGSAPGGRAEGSAPAGKGESPAPDAEKEGGETSAFFAEGKEIQGAFIAGVASSSRRKSIRVWNGRTRYNEWEFIGVEVSPTGTAPAQPSQPSAPGQPGYPTFAPPGSRMPGGRTNQPFPGKPGWQQ